jgi:hypothetical protein
MGETRRENEALERRLNIMPSCAFRLISRDPDSRSRTLAWSLKPEA